MSQQPRWQPPQVQYNHPQGSQQVPLHNQPVFPNPSTQVTSPHHTVLILLAITILIAIPMLYGGVFVWFNVLNASCTVGVTGYAANVEFIGLGAAGACSSFIKSNPAHFYQYQGEPNGTELCVGNYQIAPLFIGIGSLSVHYVVRDTGLFDLVGAALCSYLMKNGMDTQQ